MPMIKYANPGLQDSVTRPVAFDVIRQVMPWTGLPEGTPIQFPGTTEKMYQTGSTISEETAFNKFDTNLNWFVTVEEDYEIDQALTMAVDYDDVPQWFIDEKLGVYMRSAYSPMTATITVSHRSSDRTAAMRWRDEIRTRVATNRDLKLFMVSYSALIPTECMETAEHIHTLRENVAPYGEDFKTYWESHTKQKVIQLSDFAGKNTPWAFAETQTRVQGWFDFDIAPEKGQRADETASWTVSFSFTVKYDVPVSTVMHYPLMVHNQLVDKKYRPTAKNYQPEDYKLAYSMSSRALAHFEAARITDRLSLPGIAIPEFDEFIPGAGSVKPDTTRLVTLLTNIDTEGDPRVLMNLREMGEYSIESSVLTYLEGEAYWLTRLGQSCIHVNVYRGKYLMLDTEYVVDSDLNIKLTADPDLRQVYHVRLSIYTRPRLMPLEAKDRMRNNCTAARKLLLELYPSLEIEGLLPSCMVGNYMAKEPFERALGIIDAKHDSKYNGQLYQFNTVASVIIESNKRE